MIGTVYPRDCLCPGGCQDFNRCSPHVCDWLWVDRKVAKPRFIPVGKDKIFGDVARDFQRDMIGRQRSSLWRGSAMRSDFKWPLNADGPVDVLCNRAGQWWREVF